MFITHTRRVTELKENQPITAGFDQVGFGYSWLHAKLS